MNEPDPMEETGIERRDPRRCTAHNRAGAPCGKFAMRGQTVCRAHGGASPQAMANAEQMIEIAELRLRGLAPRAVAELEALVTSASSEQVRLGAANSLADRSLGRATERIQVAAAITVKRPW